MRPFFLPALNGLVRNEPCVPAATQILSPSMRPACDVALVLIWHAKCESIQFDATRLRKVKNIFVTVVEKSLGIDRLKMAKRSVAAEILNCDGFDPVNRVLQHE